MVSQNATLRSPVENLVPRKAAPAPKAARPKSATWTPTYRKLTLSASPLSDLPAGTVLNLVPVDANRLSFGDVVCGMDDQKPVVGRFLKLYDGDVVQLAQGGRRMMIHYNALLGKVERAEYGGRHFDPNVESPMMRLVHRFTRFGTRFSFAG